MVAPGWGRRSGSGGMDLLSCRCWLVDRPNLVIGGRDSRSGSARISQIWMGPDSRLFFSSLRSSIVIRLLPSSSLTLPLPSFLRPDLLPPLGSIPHSLPVGRKMSSRCAANPHDRWKNWVGRDGDIQRIFMIWTMIGRGGGGWDESWDE